MPEPRTRPQSNDIFKRIAKNPSPSGNGQTPAPVQEPSQPAASAPAAGGQVDPGQTTPVVAQATAPAAPQANTQATQVTPPQEPVSSGGTQEPQELVINDPEAVINIGGEKIKAKDAVFFGASRARQLQEEERIANARKNAQALADRINTKLSDPVIKDYLYLSDAHPEWTPEQVRDAALRANGTVLPRAPEEQQPAEKPIPKAPAGATPGDQEWNDWFAEVIDASVEKRIAPVVSAEEARKRADDQTQQYNRVTNENLNLIRNRTQEFTHVNLEDLSSDEKEEFLGKVGEVLQRRGYQIGNDNRWNTRDGRIDENIYAMAVEAAWPLGTSPKKEPIGTQPKDIVSHHMNTGLGLVPDPKSQPSPTPPSAAMPVQTPIKSQRPRSSGNKFNDFVNTGKVSA